MNRDDLLRRWLVVDAADWSGGAVFCGGQHSCQACNPAFRKYVLGGKRKGEQFFSINYEDTRAKFPKLTVKIYSVDVTRVAQHAKAGKRGWALALCHHKSEGVHACSCSKFPCIGVVHGSVEVTL